MIKFFRHIRKSLLMENKTEKPASRTGRYFKYAVGEVLLVVVGILIALQINTWNENRKESELEKSLLYGVLKSISNDTIILNEEHDNFQRILEYADFIKEKFANDTPYDKKLDTAFALISEGYNNDVDYIAFDRILSVGINIIKNDSLSNLLNRYYAQSKQMVYIENYFENNKIFRQKIYPKYFKSYKHTTEVIPIDYEILKSSTEFNIALDYAINDATFFKLWSERKKNNALKLIHLLKVELNNTEDD